MERLKYFHWMKKKSKYGKAMERLWKDYGNIMKFLEQKNKTGKYGNIISRLFPYYFQISWISQIGKENFKVFYLSSTRSWEFWS